MSPPTPRCQGNVCTHTVDVWRRENYYSSDQAKDETGSITKKVEIRLPKGAKELCGKYVCIRSEMKLSDLLSCPPFKIHDRTHNPCFSYRFAYYTIDRYVRYLSDKLDIDIHMVRENMHKKAHRILPVRVNFTGLENAFYFHKDEELTFGDGKGKFLMATDGDILVHETSHWVMDMINPLLGESFFGAGMAVHEGCADVLAALFFDDPQVAEDIGFMRLGRGYRMGLRTVKNSMTFQKIFRGHTLDPHIIGKAYSGFFWSLADRFTKLLKERNEEDYKKNPKAFREQARIATMKLILAHVVSYSVPSPSHADFTDAVITGADSLAGEGGEESDKLLKELTAWNIDLPTIRREIRAEAGRRGFNWVAKKMGGTQAQPMTLSGISFSQTPIKIVSAGRGKTLFYQQLYRTRRFGSVPVLGHGKLIRKGNMGVIRSEHTKGVVHIKVGSIDETNCISRQEAFRQALTRGIGHLRRKLTRRSGGAAMSAADINWMVTLATKALKAKGANSGQPAILSARVKRNIDGRIRTVTKPVLVWNFKEGPINIAIDAKSGKMVGLKIRGVID